jgi:ElaB/YqjD/DUF883 family membrane-anchored ribosome-binding protein
VEDIGQAGAEFRDEQDKRIFSARRAGRQAAAARRLTCVIRTSDVPALRQDMSYTGCGALADSRPTPSFLQWGLAPAPLAVFHEPDKRNPMNSETTDSISSMNTSSSGLNGSAGDGTVRRVAQKAHEAVDTLAQTLDSSSEKVMNWHQEYGDMAREQVRANPLAVVAGAFVVGFVLAKLTR